MGKRSSFKTLKHPVVLAMYSYVAPETTRGKRCGVNTTTALPKLLSGGTFRANSWHLLANIEVEELCSFHWLEIQRDMAHLGKKTARELSSHSTCEALARTLLV